MSESALIMRVEDIGGVLPPGIHIRFATAHPLWGLRWTTYSTGLAGVVFLPIIWCGRSVLDCRVYDADGQLKAQYNVQFQFPTSTSSVLVLKVHPPRASWWKRWIQGFLIEGLVPVQASLARRISHISIDNPLKEQADLMTNIGGRRLDIEEHDDVTKNSCQKSNPSNI